MNLFFVKFVFIIGCILISHSVFSINEDSLVAVLNKPTSLPNDKLKALQALIKFYKRKDQAKAELYTVQFESIYKKLKDTTEFTGIYHLIKGYQLQYKGEQQNAIRHLEVAEIAYSKLKDNEALWGVYNNFGSTYGNMGNLPKSLTYYLKAMAISEKHLGDDATAGTAMNIGVIYGEQKMFKEALRYFRLSASVYGKIEGSWGYGNNLNNMGQSFGALDQMDSAEYYYKAAIVVWNKLEDEQGLAMTYHNLGNLYGETNRFIEAERFLQKSLDLSYKMGDAYGITVNLGILSKLAFNKGFRDKGYNYLYESLKYSKQNQLLNLENENYKMLYQEHKEDNNFKMALDFHEKFFQTYDSIHNSENNKILKELQGKYESEKKQSEIDNQKLVITDKDLKISEQSRQSIIYISIIGLSILIIGFVFYQFKQKQKSNKIILSQKIEVEKQKEIVFEKQKEIVDSITYAKRLQDAILPPHNLLNKHLPEHFVLYRPKDIVAGDFYWFEQTADFIFLAAADSTGHGVPGAMVSVVCSNALHRAVNEFKITETGKILDKTRDLVLETFSKSESEVMDGMDISLISINKNQSTQHTTINWSGANNVLWYIKQGELIEIKAHKQPIGKTDSPTSFPTHSIAFNKGDIIYLITDGLPDQFGGPKGKKFKYKQLKSILIAQNQLSMKQQQNYLEKAFDDWKGGLEQVDDVTIIGIKL